MSNTTAQSWHEPLGDREIEILSLISEGYTNRRIAQRLSLSLDTIKWYNKQLFSKLGVSSRTQAAAAARQYGLLESEQPTKAVHVSRSRHNLPHIPTSFVGRHREMEEIRHLLRTSRLVVLTGAGGSGKTRLALQVANELVDHYPDGVWLVELAPISDPGIVPNAIADVLNVNQSGEAPLISNIQHFLKSKRLLLVLDNFEHLLEAAPLVGDLVEFAPRVSILATSRERLRIYGEMEYPVQPLNLPDLGAEISRDHYIRYESISLFIDRARAVKRDLEMGPEDLAAVSQICLRLDGLPLALELAASRIKIFPLTALAERLEDRMSVLTGGPRDLPMRQRTLRDTIDWSYNLLEDGERSLFARLSVFRSGGTLEAVERISGQGLPGDLVAHLSSLVDKSLVRTRDTHDGELRFEMLETIRVYAWERLDASGEKEGVEQRHAAYYAELAERAAGEIRYARGRYWFARLRNEYDNLRYAMGWSLSGQEVDYGLRMTAALRDYWYYTGQNNEFRHWTELALMNMQSAPVTLQAGVKMCTSQRYFGKRDSHIGIELLDQAIDLYEQHNDKNNLAWALMFKSTLYIGDMGSYRLGLSLGMRSLEAFRDLDDLAGQAQALNILGEYTRTKGDLADAKVYYEQSLQVVEQTGERLREAMLNENLGFIACRQGRYRKSLELIRKCLRIMDEYQNDYGLMTTIASLSGPIAALGQPERAVKLLAGTRAQLEVIGAEHQPADLPEIENYAQQVHEQLGDELFQAAWEVGSRLTIRELVDMAFEEAPAA